MRRLISVLSALAVLLLPVSASAARPSVGVVQNFGQPLAGTCPNPEGIAIDPTGKLYAASFAFKPVANICVVDRRGALVARSLGWSGWETIICHASSEGPVTRGLQANSPRGSPSPSTW